MLYDQSKDYNRTGLNLLASAKYMEEHGHTKGVLMDSEGRVCLQGALQAVIFGDPAHWDWMRSEEARLQSFNEMVACLEVLALTKGGKLNPSSLGYLVQWNNDRNTTGQDVIDLFRRAAENCKLPVEASAV